MSKGLPYSNEIKNQLCEKFKEYEMDGYTLLSCNDKELQEYGIPKLICVNLEDFIKDENKKYRSIDTSNPKIKSLITVNPKYPDCITFENSGHPRCLMNCGHAITAPSMYQWISSKLKLFFSKHICIKHIAFTNTHTHIHNIHKVQLGKSDTVTNIHCPIPECKKEWDWTLCLSIANMDKKETQKWMSLVATREIQKYGCDFKQCPVCQTVMTKPEALTQAWFVTVSAIQIYKQKNAHILITQKKHTNAQNKLLFGLLVFGVLP